MIKLPEKLSILVACDYVDMRKGANGLCVLAQDELKKSPQSSTVFVFYNRRKDKVKALFWDKEGFVLLCKQLERGKFCFPSNRFSPYAISHAQLNWLLCGLDFMRLEQRPESEFSAYI
jgi:transposase